MKDSASILCNDRYVTDELLPCTVKKVRLGFRIFITNESVNTPVWFGGMWNTWCDINFGFRSFG